MNYDSLQSTASKLLAKFGQPITVASVSKQYERPR